MPLYLLIAIVPISAACTSLSVAIYAWQRRRVTGANAFSLCMVSVCIWCFFAIFEQLSLGQVARETFAKAQHFGIATFPALWLIFTVRYTQCDRWLSRTALTGIGAIPALTLLLTLTDRWHRLIWQAATLVSLPFPHLQIEHGWWFDHVMLPYNYLMVVVGFGVLIAALFSESRLYRQQTLFLMAAALFPFIFNVLYVVSDITLYGLDLTPVGFALSGVLIQAGLFRTRFLDIAPISYKTIFLNTADAVILLDIERRIVDLNPSALTESRLQATASDVRGLPFDKTFPDYAGLLEQAVNNAEFTGTIKLPRRLGSQHTGLLTDAFREVKVRSLLTTTGRQVGWAAIIRDVTLEKQQREQLERLAYVDSLTGLFNRRQLELTAEDIFSGSSLDAGSTVVLLYIDLNHFKPINDTYGHDVGDAVLQYFAHCLKGSVRKGDLVARLGGDEFAALLYDADPSVAMEVRSRLVKAISSPVTLLTHCLSLSASVGVAYYPTDGDNLAELLRQADQKMYWEKRLTKETAR